MTPELLKDLKARLTKLPADATVAVVCPNRHETRALKSAARAARLPMARLRWVRAGGLPA